ncbi:MAG: HPr family phosphocarrier protein [Pyrinomonadaceae bacterium]
MVEIKVKIVNQLGLHARAAAQLVRLASNFSSRIIIKRSDEADLLADAKSILSVLNLAASRGTVLELEFEGEDEKAASVAIEELISGGFGEM